MFENLKESLLSLVNLEESVFKKTNKRLIDYYDNLLFEKGLSEYIESCKRDYQERLYLMSEAIKTICSDTELTMYLRFIIDKTFEKFLIKYYHKTEENPILPKMAIQTVDKCLESIISGRVVNLYNEKEDKIEWISNHLKTTEHVFMLFDHWYNIRFNKQITYKSKLEEGEVEGYISSVRDLVLYDKSSPGNKFDVYVRMVKENKDYLTQFRRELENLIRTMKTPFEKRDDIKINKYHFELLITGKLEDFLSIYLVRNEGTYNIDAKVDFVISKIIDSIKKNQENYSFVLRDKEYLINNNISSIPKTIKDVISVFKSYDSWKNLDNHFGD